MLREILLYKNCIKKYLNLEHTNSPYEKFIIKR